MKHGRLQPYAWLGAGAITLGVGAALASGSAVAHAETGDAPGASTSANGGDGAAKSAQDDSVSAANEPSSPDLHGSETHVTTDNGVDTSSKEGDAVASGRLNESPSATTKTLTTGSSTLSVQSNTSRSLSADIDEVRDASSSGATTAAAPSVAAVAVKTPSTPGSPEKQQLPVDVAPTAAPMTLGSRTATSTVSTAAVTTAVAPEPMVIANVPVGAQPNNAVLSADGRRLYVLNYQDKSVTVVDTVTNSAIGSPIAVGDSPFAMTISPDGSRVYVANFYGSSVSVINTSTGESVPISVSYPDTVVVTPDGSRVYVSSADRTVSAIDAETGVLYPVGNMNGRALASAVSPDGRYVYLLNPYNNSTPFPSSTPDGGVTIVDTATNTIVGQPVPVGYLPTDLKVSPDGRYVYVSNSQPAGTRFDGGDLPPGTVSVIDSTTRAVVAVIPVGYLPGSIVVSPDGSRLYVANRQQDGTPPGRLTSLVPGNISVIDTATWTTVGDPIPSGLTVGSGLGPATFFAISPDGSRLYIADSNYQAYDPATGSLPAGVLNVIDTATGTAVGSPVRVGVLPGVVLASADGSRVYVINQFEGGATATGALPTGTVTIISTGVVGPVTPSAPVDPLGPLFETVGATLGQALVALSQLYQSAGELVGTTLSSTAALLGDIAAANASLLPTVVNALSQTAIIGLTDTGEALNQFYDVLGGLSQIAAYTGFTAAGNVVLFATAFTYGVTGDIAGVTYTLTDQIGNLLSARGVLIASAPLFLIGQAVSIYSYALNAAAHTDFSDLPNTLGYAAANPIVVVEEVAKATVTVLTQVGANIISALNPFD